jgi:hypothetical protein
MTEGGSLDNLRRRLKECRQPDIEPERFAFRAGLAWGLMPEIARITQERPDSGRRFNVIAPEPVRMQWKAR